jgi:hypothetical protein
VKVEWGYRCPVHPRPEAKLRNSDVALRVTKYQAGIVTARSGDIQKLLTRAFDAGKQHRI